MSSEHPRSAEELVAILKHECDVRRDKVRIARLGSITLVTALLLLGLYSWLAKGVTPLQFLNDYGAFFLVAAGGVALSAKHRKALLAVHEYDERLVNYLIEALTYHDTDVVLHAEGILAVQLSTLSKLSEEHCRMITLRLVRSNNLDFLEAALLAVRKFGDTECIEGIEAFHERKTPQRESVRFEKLKAMALEASADIRMRGARKIIESTEQEAQLRLTLRKTKANDTSTEEPSVQERDGNEL